MAFSRQGGLICKEGSWFCTFAEMNRLLRQVYLRQWKTTFSSTCGIALLGGLAFSKANTTSHRCSAVILIQD